MKQDELEIMLSNDRSCFNLVESCFVGLASPPNPLTIDGAALGNGLPARSVTLDELRRLMVNRKTSWLTVETVWRELVRRAREEEENSGAGVWVTVAIGMMLPALRKIGNKLVSHWPGERADLDAVIYEGFLQAFKYIDLSEPRIYYSLRDSAKWRAQEACNRENRVARSSSGREERVSLYPRGGNPDFVLAKASEIGALSERDVDLIYEVYLLRTRPEDIAENLGLAVECFEEEVQRAVLRLVEYLKVCEFGAGMSVGK